MKISRVVEKYVRLVTDMYDSVLRCAFGVKDWFMILMARLTYAVKQESSWSMILQMM